MLDVSFHPTDKQTQRPTSSAHIPTRPSAFAAIGDFLRTTQLAEIEFLQALVIIDNEIDVLFLPAPDTVKAGSGLGEISMKLLNNDEGTW